MPGLHPAYDGGAAGARQTMSRPKDMTGQRFGQLVVIRRAPSRDGRTYWLCRCDCGEEVEVNRSNLISGRQTSCGKHRINPRLEDLTGKSFGDLTVLRHVGQRGNNTIWQCRCICGKITEVAANNLKNGHTTSCGCRQEKEWYSPEKRIAALRASPNTGRFETNRAARDWILVSSEGKHYDVHNLTHFVRNHPELFDITEDDADVNRAVKRLADAAYRDRVWHGWKVIRKYEK